MGVNGIALSRRFFHELVQPLLPSDLPYTAARIGSGSDVLGLDDERSRDHDWGCRLHLFVPDAWVQELDELLDRSLPAQFMAQPVRFAVSWDERVRHRVEVVSVADFVASRLGFDATRELDPIEWLALTGQSVLEVIGGEVFVDHSGELT